MQPLYNVPIIPLNLRKEETIVQIAEALQYLQDVSEDIFKRVNERIELNSQHLANISDRIDQASKKILSLSGAKKATQVFSSSKYPASHVNRQYQSVFGKSDEPITITRHKIKSKSSAISEEPLDKLHFYHVKLRESETKVSNDTLGPIPTDIELFNDLLLYNTGKNPYKNYELSDTLKVSPRLQEDKATSTSDIGPAPLSISDRSSVSKTSTESYFYTPNLGEVPSIDVPLDLPDLPGIADDLRFENVANVAIAPSVTTTPSFPDLPDFLDLSVTTPGTSEISLDVNDFLPPPPSPPPLAETVEQAPDPKPPETIAVTEAVAETQTPEVPQVVEEQKPPVAPVNTLDAHASLMEAIRKAGGSKSAHLKSTEAAKAESTPPPGDLMADLHAKLAMRRKGISGAKALDGSGGGNAMDKVSAMIPPPPSGNDISSSTNTEDDDWDE